jgi:molybdopterin molybdotransferase
MRMHGFRERSEVPAVLEWIDRHASRLDAETVRLEEASGRTLAADVIAPLDVPGFDRAAMDGFALRGAETAGATDYNPLEFRVVGQAVPGQAFAGNSRRDRQSDHDRRSSSRKRRFGHSCRVRHRVRRADRGKSARCRASTSAIAARNIQAGSVALGDGERLRPQDVGLVGSLGLDHVTAVRQPRVRVLVTGNEVRAPGTAKEVFEVYDANSYMLRGLISRDGGVLESHHRLGDDPDRIRAALLAPRADVILVSAAPASAAKTRAATDCGARRAGDTWRFDAAIKSRRPWPHR